MAEPPPLNPTTFRGRTGIGATQTPKTRPFRPAAPRAHRSKQSVRPADKPLNDKEIVPHRHRCDAPPTEEPEPPTWASHAPVRFLGGAKSVRPRSIPILTVIATSIRSRTGTGS